MRNIAKCFTSDGSQSCFFQHGNSMFGVKRTAAIINSTMRRNKRFKTLATSTTLRHQSAVKLLTQLFSSTFLSSIFVFGEFYFSQATMRRILCNLLFLIFEKNLHLIKVGSRAFHVQLFLRNWLERRWQVNYSKESSSLFNQIQDRIAANFSFLFIDFYSASSDLGQHLKNSHPRWLFPQSKQIPVLFWLWNVFSNRIEWQSDKRIWKRTENSKHISFVPSVF